VRVCEKETKTTTNALESCFKDAHMSQSRHTHVWVMSHVWRSHLTHVTHMNKSCHTYEGVMSHIWRSHVTHLKESCHKYEGVMSHIWRSHVTHITGTSRARKPNRGLAGNTHNFSKVSSIVMVHSQLYTVNSAACCLLRILYLWEPYRGRTGNKFSKVSSMVIAYGPFNSVLIFENFWCAGRIEYAYARNSQTTAL